MRFVIPLLLACGGLALTAVVDASARPTRAHHSRPAKKLPPRGDPPGTRCTHADAGAGPPNRPASARLRAVSKRATPDGLIVRLRTTARDPDRNKLLYTYSATGGRIVGDGPAVAWTLTDPGTYTASVEVDDGHGCVTFDSITQAVPAKL
jgi:hypothetical protein